MFIDESGFMMQPLAGRTWAPRGQTPLLEQWDRRDRISAITALSLSPQRRRVQMHFDLLARNANAKAEDFIDFLQRLHEELGRKLHVVWDNLGAHAKAEKFFQAIDCSWIQFHRLPPYAPELNPVEHVWSTAKRGELAGKPPDDADHLRDLASDQLGDQSLRQSLLKAHFRWAGLGLA